MGAVDTSQGNMFSKLTETGVEGVISKIIDKGRFAEVTLDQRQYGLQTARIVPETQGRVSLLSAGKGSLILGSKVSVQVVERNDVLVVSRILGFQFPK